MEPELAVTCQIAVRTWQPGSDLNPTCSQKKGQVLTGQIFRRGSLLLRQPLLCAVHKAAIGDILHYTVAQAAPKLALTTPLRSDCAAERTDSHIFFGFSACQGALLVWHECRASKAAAPQAREGWQAQ